MKFSSLIGAVIGFSSALLSVRGDEESSEEAVFTLTTANFDSFIGEHNKVLVEFYAPWCGHCKALAPEYESAAQALKEDSAIETVLAKVDATEEKDLATKYGVRGFPTLKYFTNGDVESPADYTGGRTKDTIVTWLSQRALPPVTNLETEDDLNNFKSKSKVVLVYYLPESDSNKAKGDELETIADGLRESLLVGRVTNADLIKSLNNVNEGDVFLYRQFDEPEIKFDGTFSESAVTEFVNAEKFPLIDAIGPENYKDYIDRGLPLVWIALDASDESELKKVVDLLTPYAKDNKGKLSFTYVDNKKYAQHVQNLGITEVPGLLIVGDDKYLLQEPLTEESAKKFFEGYSSGSLEAFMKSQEIPESNDENVFVLVGKNFKQVVGSDKDVFVEFYAPWCGHCKRLAPEYEKVGDAFASVDKVVVAKIDATENDTPEEIKGFPTLFFYPAGSKTGEKYNGERTAEAIIDFIKTKATVDVSNIKEEL